MVCAVQKLICNVLSSGQHYKPYKTLNWEPDLFEKVAISEWRVTKLLSVRNRGRGYIAAYINHGILRRKKNKTKSNSGVTQQ